VADSAEIASWRRAERARLLALRLAAAAPDREGWSAAIEAQLGALLAAETPAAVGFYWPVRGEFDARPLLARLMAAGWAAALPAVLAPRAPMEYRRWTPESPMETGFAGIPAPAERGAVEPAVLLVPLVGFDAARYRLGYGGGFFDRTLAALPRRPRTIGIGFELGRLESVRPQPHDIAMDRIVTEAGRF
jgi:5-formyltetrahydrofolate cyclo-ligase